MKPDQLSQTAAFIAIKFYGLTRMEPYRSMFDPKVIQFYERLVQSLPSPLNWYYNGLKKSWIRKFFITYEELLLPGDIMHIVMRKQIIGQEINRLLSDNFGQLLVLGAGFDHLGVFHSGQDIPSFEMDAPRMARLKKEFVRTNDYENDHLSITPIYFSETFLREVLQKETRIDPSRNTIIVAEGFFDYLEPATASKIIDDLSVFFKNRLKVISTIFALDELPAFHRWVFKAGVRMVGENIRLGLSREELYRLFELQGFGIHEVLNSSDMRNRLKTPEKIDLSVLKGFYLLNCGKN